MAFDMDPSGGKLQSLDDTHIRDSMSRTACRVAELEKIVGFLLAKMIQGETVSLADGPVRRFLRIPEDAKDNPAKYLQVALAALEPKGLLRCGACGAKAKDIPGFFDEKCPICGEPIGSET